MISHRLMQRTVIGLVSLWFSLTSLNTAAIELIPHVATYKTKIKKGFTINGEALRELKPLKNGEWLYRFNVESFAADIEESVRLRWEDEKVVPLQYQYDLSGMLVKNRYQDIQFDWEAGIAIGKHDGRKWELALQPNALDRLGYQLQLLVDINRYSERTPLVYQAPIATPIPSELGLPPTTGVGNQPTLESNTLTAGASPADINTLVAPIHYEIIHRGKPRDSLFQITGEEILKTPLGHFDTVKVVKKREEKKKRQTHLWFSKSYPFLLLKMIQVEKDGERYEINVSSAKIDGQSIL